MQRALDRLSSEQFDVLIVGGGATGCFAARDCAMRGLKVALVEARDFASATSAHNSKLAHGGLRYLRNLEFALVRESLAERRNLMRIAPHLVRPLPFLLPLVGAGLGERLKLKAGLALYDILSFDRNRGVPARLPGHRWLNRREAAVREPVLADDRLEGAFEYHDAQMFSPERIALENLIDADAHGAAIANYVAADKLLLREGKAEGATVHEVTTGAVFDIRARTVLVAAGPWADLFLERVTGHEAAHKLIRSKGIHLLVPRISESALTIEAGSGHLFALPWRGHTLLATTDTPFTGDPATVAVTEEDVEGLLAMFRTYLPHAGLSADKVQFFYAGLRPLVIDGSPKNKTKISYDVSRRSELVDHADEGLDGVFSALGGKWTTSRRLAQIVTDALVKKLGANANACATAATPLPGGRFDDFDQMMKGFQKTWPGIGAMRTMAHMLGARLPLAMKGARLADLAKLGESGDTLAQVNLALREEMTLTLEDMVMRRTCVGQFGPPPAAVTARIADLMAAQLGWNGDKKQREIDSLDKLYRVTA